MKLHLIILLFGALTVVSCKSKKITSAAYKAEIAEHRATYKSNFLKEEHSPLVETDFQYLDFFDANVAFDCNCKVELTKGEKPFDVDTYAGKKKSYLKYAIATCPIEGNIIKVALYKIMRLQSMPGFRDYLFLPFMDHTNGETTYGGGRYIDLKVDEITDEGYINIDFNKCYNPYCAFSDGYNCPIPPVENHIELAINAGEKNYKGKKKKRH